MLKIISVLTLVYCLSSTALPESDSNYDAYKGYNKPPLPLQLADAASRNYYESGGKQVKPCSKGQDTHSADVADQEVEANPTYSARVVKYNDNVHNNLKPQSLKNVFTNNNKPYNDVLELYSYDKQPGYKGEDQTSSDEENAQDLRKDKVVKALNDDDAEVSGRNAFHDETDDSAQYGNQKYKAKDKDYSDNPKRYETQSGLPLDNKNTKTEDKQSAYGKKFSSEEQGASESDSKSYNVDNDNLQAKDTGRNTKYNGNTLTDAYDKNKYYDESESTSEENYEVKSGNVQKDAGQFDENPQSDKENSQLKSSNKYLTLANYKARNSHADSDNEEDTNSGVKNTKILNDELRDKLNADHGNDDDDLFDKLAKNKYYSDELNGKYSKKTNAYDSDEVEDALAGILRNKAVSDELNDALYEIKKHLAHSDELINALKLVGEKGKTYSDVLNDAMFKVKKHKAQSNEFDRDHNLESSDESDLSDADSILRNKNSHSKENTEKYDKDDYNRKLEVLKKLKADLADSSEDDRKCPSKHKKLSAKQLKEKDVTRRLLTESDESESLSSFSDEGADQKGTKYSDENNANKLGKQSVQKTDVDKSKAKTYSVDEDDSQTAEEKEGEDDNDNVNDSGRSVANTKSGLDLLNPARGPGVSSLSAQGLNLLDHRRVCYACSSDFNPSCFEPNRLTTVKYCHYGHDKCITKTFTDPYDQHQVVIRDCGDSCSVGSTGSALGWNSCEVCEDDLCNSRKFEPNGAFSINSQSFVFSIFVILAIKFTI